MSPNTNKIWESILLDKFPNTPKEKIQEIKTDAAVAWMFGEQTQMTDLYDKYVMMKRLMDINPKTDKD